MGKNRKALNLAELELQASLLLSVSQAFAALLVGPRSASPNQKRTPLPALRIGPVKSSHLNATLRRGRSVPVIPFFPFLPFYLSLK